MHHRFLPRALLAIAAGLFGFAPGVQAQTFPSKPVRIVCTLSAGGSADVAVRIFAHYLGERLGQQVLVENRTGAGGIIGTDSVAKGPADGYTLLLGSSHPFGIAQALGKRLPYDAERDFIPVALLNRIPLAFIIHPSVPAKTVRELIDYARANPGKLRYASPGTGHIVQLATEMFKLRYTLDITHIPYKSGIQAVVDVGSGQVEMMMAGTVSAVPRVRSGQVRGLAVTSAKRSPLLPEMPTMMESGLADFTASDWFGLLAPAGVSPAVLAKLVQETAAVVQLAEYRKRMIDTGAEDPEVLTGEAFTRYIRSEAARLGEVIVAAGIKDEE